MKNSKSFASVDELRWCQDNAAMLKEKYFKKYLVISNHRVWASAETIAGADKKAKKLGLTVYVIIGVCTPEKSPVGLIGI